MEWNPIQTNAKSKGCLIFAISQSSTPPMTQDGPWGDLTHGYCLGLSANWISLAYKGSDFLTDGDVCNNPPWQSTMAQNLAQIPGTVWTDYWKAATEPFQCTLSKHLHATRHNKPSADFLWSIMSKAYGCYGVTLENDIAAHAIALRHGHDNRYHLFDPNYFHVAMKGVDTFKHFVSAYLRDTGYRDAFKMCGVTGIVPPISA